MGRLQLQRRQVTGARADHRHRLDLRTSLPEMQALFIPNAFPKHLFGDKGQRLERLRAIGPGETAWTVQPFDPIASRRLAVADATGQLRGSLQCPENDGPLAHQRADAAPAGGTQGIDQPLQGLAGQKSGNIFGHGLPWITTEANSFCDQIRPITPRKENRMCEV